MSFDRVLRRKYVEVGLGDAKDELLLSCLEIGFGLRNLSARALDRHPVVPGDQTLTQVEAPAISFGFCGAGGEEVEDDGLPVR